MGWAERGMGRLFAVALVIVMAASTSWFAAPLAERILDRAGTIVADLGLGSTGTAAAEAAGPLAGSTGAADPLARIFATDPSQRDPGQGGAVVGVGSAERPGFRDGSVLLPTDDGYVWPLVGAKITTWFAPTRSGSMVLGGEAVHNGLDIALPCWTPIRAAHDGKVLYAGRRADPYLGFSTSVQPYYDELARRGLTDRALPIMVVVDDGNGLISVYAHLVRATAVAGGRVSAGEAIGYEGATGNATGCHLHYSLIVAHGPWVEVAPLLVEKWHYPRYMRLRVDPLLYLSLDSPDAARPADWLDPRPEPPTYVGGLPSPSDAFIGQE